MNGYVVLSAEGKRLLQPRKDWIGILLGPRDGLIDVVEADGSIGSYHPDFLLRL